MNDVPMNDVPMNDVPMNDVLVVSDDAMLGHAPDGYDPNRPEWTEMIKERLGALDEGGMQYTHPERPERLEATLASLRDDPPPGLIWSGAEPVDRDAKLLVHTADHVDYVESYRGERGWLHHDTTAVSEGSCHAADVAMGAAIRAVETVVAEGGPDRAFALVRPPGHHAHADRPEGFCLYNNVAVATAWARRRLGIERVLIVDWDAHHGNGTQAIVRGEPGVMHFDVHAEAPVYPGTGPLYDTASDGAAGRLINVPVPAKSGSSAFVEAFDQILAPAARRFLPDLIIVSAGFDAHRADLLMEVDEDGFAALTGRVIDLAERYCGGRLALVLEGGYREALSRSVRACLEVLTGGREAPEIEVDLDDPGRAAVQLSNRFHSRPVYSR